MNKVFPIFICCGIAYSFFNGTSAQVFAGIVGSCEQTAMLCIRYGAIWSFWLGMMKIAEKTGLIEKFARLLSPVIRFLFPRTTSKASEYILLNVTANMIGIGNAATPFGLAAMKEMACGPVASDDMIMFVVLNTTSLQLIPLGVISLRAAFGSAEPSVVLLPILLATAITTAVGIISVKMIQKREAVKCRK